MDDEDGYLITIRVPVVLEHPCYRAVIQLPEDDDRTPDEVIRDALTAGND